MLRRVVAARQRTRRWRKRRSDRPSRRSCRLTAAAAAGDGRRRATRRGCRQPHLPWLGEHDVDDREAGVEVEAGGGEERGADVAGEERVAAATSRGCDALGLRERVESEAAGTLEPALVAGPRERLEEREAVAGGAVAETVALLVTVGACPPDELGAGEQELLVHVAPGAGDHSRGAGAPLQADAAVPWSHERPFRCARPVRQTAAVHGVPIEERCGRARESSVSLEAEQGERVPRGSVQRAEAVVVVVLPPESVLATAGAERRGGRARRLLPARLA